jgi:hypothetical protein
MRRADLKTLVCDSVHRRLATLRIQGYPALASVPTQHSEAIAGTKAVVSTYREQLADGRLRIVVQGLLPGWLGSAFIRAAGFTVDPMGTVEPLSEEALWDYT